MQSLTGYQIAKLKLLQENFIVVPLSKVNTFVLSF